MTLTSEQEKELIQNGMHPGTVGRFYYDEMRKQGLSHKESIRNFIDGVNNMRSESFSEEQLKILKSIIGRVKGEFF